jgi:hypothetical protein
VCIHRQGGVISCVMLYLCFVLCDLCLKQGWHLVAPVICLYYESTLLCLAWDLLSLNVYLQIK